VPVATTQISRTEGAAARWVAGDPHLVEDDGLGAGDSFRDFLRGGGVIHPQGTALPGKFIKRQLVQVGAVKKNCFHFSSSLLFCPSRAPLSKDLTRGIRFFRKFPVKALPTIEFIVLFLYYQ
jgi:hypothetical protein